MNHLYHNIEIRVTIGENIQFTRCKSIHIEKSIQLLTGTARLELPREFRNAIDAGGKSVDIHGKSILNFMKRGDTIKIELGYDGDLQIEFEGYITKIGADFPLILECEDEMFQLKKAPKVSKSVTSGKLVDILKAIIPKDYNVVFKEEYVIGKWVIDKATPYEALEELRNKMSLRAYFKDSKTLCVGLPVDFEPTQTHGFNFSENVRRGSNLKFERKEDRLLEVTITSTQKNGTKISYSVGDKGGDTTSINIPQLNKEEIKLWANRIYGSRNYDGFEGTLDSWCYPRTAPGDIAHISRPIYSDKHQDGKYFIEGVIISLNSNSGIKRINKLSYKI